MNGQMGIYLTGSCWTTAKLNCEAEGVGWENPKTFVARLNTKIVPSILMPPGNLLLHVVEDSTH